MPIKRFCAKCVKCPHKKMPLLDLPKPEGDNTAGLTTTIYYQLAENVLSFPATGIDMSTAAVLDGDIELTSGHTTSGSAGSAPTAIPRNIGQAAFGGTVEVNNTTQASAGTIVTHYVWNWNIRVGFDKIFTPETRPRIAPGTRMCLELPAAPADSVTMSGSITIEEI